MATETSCTVKDTGICEDNGQNNNLHDANLVLKESVSLDNVSNSEVENIESNDSLSFDSCRTKLKYMVRNLHRPRETAVDEIAVPVLCYHPKDVTNNVVFNDLHDMLKPHIERKKLDAKTSLFEKVMVAEHAEGIRHRKVSSSKVTLCTNDLECLFFPRHSLSSNIIDFYISW